MYAVPYFRIVVVRGSAAKCLLQQLRSSQNTTAHDILNVFITLSIQLVSFVVLFYMFVEKFWVNAQRQPDCEGSMAQKINPRCRTSKENDADLGQLRMAFWRKCFTSELAEWQWERRQSKGASMCCCSSELEKRAAEEEMVRQHHRLQWT